MSDEPRLPIKLDPVSNGEFFPLPKRREVAAAQQTALERIAENARKVGVSRRELLRSTCGAATVLLALNETGCGSFRVPREAEVEPEAAEEALSGKELVFDVQTHHVSADRPWYRTDRPSVATWLPHTAAARCGEPEWVRCFTRDAFLKEVFFDSDTRMGVLSALYGDEAINPLLAEEAALTRERMAKMEGAPRLRIHGIVLPKAHTPAQTEEHMQALVEKWGIAAWKLYPVWGPEGKGWRLDDPETGLRVVRRGVALGVPLVAVHKGVPLAGMDPAFTRPDDVGPAAKAVPEATFLIYHSGWEPDLREGPYDPSATRGVDALIRSVEEHGTSNVYAELGSLWRGIMGDAEQAGHVIGKLLKHFGEDRILWGTDCIWYGSPQDQIQAFRAFQIPPELRERHGYPELTEQARQKIFGLNAVRVYGVDHAEVEQALRWDPVAKAKDEYGAAPRPSFETYGPRTRREMLAFLRLQGGLPG